ncbi:MAG: hypothetical protein PHQ65_12895 [Bacteroidales bacterium]|nr:hypothetical protein [Bacteroidales bacterium]MDD3666156.1 hypothetical protein [Bacteroidales bacterium]
MKRLFFYISLLVVFSTTYSQTIDSKINSKADTLSHLVKLIDRTDNVDSNRIYRDLFFKAFPKTFAQFVKIYGYQDSVKCIDNEISTKFYKSILYDNAKHHIIDIYYTLHEIDINRRFISIINIAKNGCWQADAVNFFKLGANNLLQENLDVFIKNLIKFDNSSVLGFWFFYFDSPCPPKKLPEFLEPVRLKNKRIYDLMIKSLLKVQKEWDRENSN